MKEFDFSTYEQKFFNQINFKIVKELIKLKEEEEIKINLSDGEFILKKVKGVYNAN